MDLNNKDCRRWMILGTIVGVGVIVFVTVVVSTATLKDSKLLIAKSPRALEELSNVINATLDKARAVDEKLLKKLQELEESTRQLQNVMPKKIENLQSDFKSLKSIVNSGTNKNDLSNIDEKVKESVNEILSSDRKRIIDIDTKISNVESSTFEKLSTFEKTIKRLNDSIIEVKVVCPEKTTKVRRECFTFHMDHRPWQGSYDFCKKQGGFMPEFDNPDLGFMELLKSIPELEKKVKEDSRSSIPFWLDAKDDIKEGEWLWGSGARLLLNDTRWAPGQPNNHGGGQHCLIVDYDKSKGFEQLTVGLEDNPCNLSFNIICEYFPKVKYFN